MSSMSSGISSQFSIVGGVLSYPSEQLREEVACIAFHFHWSLEDILNLEHSSRREWVTEIEKFKPYSAN